MNKKIPIVLSVSGHRHLEKQNLDILRSVVEEQIKALVLDCPNSPVKLLTCLAEGADQLCAEAALKLGLGLIVALPMELKEYKKDFEGDALARFEDLLSKAEKVVVAPCIEESEKKDRDYYYRQADIYLAEHSHALLALWDGSAPKENGCGTAETVDFVLNYSYAHKDRCVKKDDGFVIHILSHREGSTDAESDAGTLRFLGDEALFKESIHKLDELNREGSDADKLSVEYGKKYHRLLMLLAIIGTAIAICFLLYDEVMINGMLIALGILLVAMFAAFKLAAKSHSHEKYIEYRALAESIRVQNHLNRIGSDLEVSNFLDWSRRFDTPWIHKAMQTFVVMLSVDNSEDISKDWIVDQQNYHEKAAAKTKKQIKHNKTIVSISVIASVTIYIFALIFEYGLSFHLAVQQAELIRVIIKITIGGLSAASLFAANYYGKLSLNRVYEDHIKMAEFFKKSQDYVLRFGVSEELIKELVNEELSENSNWYSYEKDNEIDLTL